MSGLTAAAVAFACSLDFESIPSAAVHAAKRCIVDGIGVEIAGMSEPVMTVLDGYLRRIGGVPEVRAVFGDGHRMPAHLAALRNGTAGHAMDWDDTQLPASPDRLYGFLTHPTTTPLAAGLALADRTRISGRTFLAAFLAGLEVECKLSEAISPEHSRCGYQSTATVGTFGSAVTAGLLSGQDARALAKTIGMAASMAAGIKANFGTMAKIVHVGRAAENGIVASDLVSEGLTANEEALDGPNGYFAAAGRGGNPERVIEHFGNPYSILDPGVSVKPYPSGVVTHQTMDAALEITRKRKFTADDIDRIDVLVGSNIAEPIRFPFARTALEAKFCMPFLVTAMILDGRAGPAQFKDEYVNSQRVVDFERRVQMRVAPDIDALGYEKVRSRLIFHLRNGETVSHEVDDRYRGGPERPISDGELQEKFRACVEGKLTDDAAGRLLDAVWKLDKQPDVSVLLELTNTGGKP